MEFKGKIGLWWYVVIVFYNIVFVSAISEPDKTGGALAIFVCYLFLVLGDIFMISCTMKNYIILEDKDLTIYFGLTKKNIKYKDLVLVKATKNPLSSMALSFDRIELQWEKGSALVAVKEKAKFIDELKRRNPSILTK